MTCFKKKKGSVLFATGHESWHMRVADLMLAHNRHECEYVPAQEIILVCVFVIYLHLQLLTRHFMDYNLMYQTHTGTWGLTEGFEWKLAAALCYHEWKWTFLALIPQIQNKWHDIWLSLPTPVQWWHTIHLKMSIHLPILPHTSLPTWDSLCCWCVWRWRSEGQPSKLHRGRTSQP